MLSQVVYEKSKIRMRNIRLELGTTSDYFK